MSTNILFHFISYLILFSWLLVVLRKLTNFTRNIPTVKSTSQQNNISHVYYIYLIRRSGGRHVTDKIPEVALTNDRHTIVICYTCRNIGVYQKLQACRFVSWRYCRILFSAKYLSLFCREGRSYSYFIYL